MAYNEKLAIRIRDVIADQKGLSEKKMFGGLAFLVNGHMCCGIVGEELMVRVGPDSYDGALKEPYVRPMDFTGRPMKGMIYVSRDGIRTKAQLARWVGKGVAYTESLPPK